MTRHVKVLVTGPFGVGKSRLVKTISEIEVVSTERRLTRAGGDGKDHTTVAMDYGRVTLGDTVVHLTGTPGQERFDFMWDILSAETDAVVLVVDLILCARLRRCGWGGGGGGAAGGGGARAGVGAVPGVGARAAPVRQVLARLIEEV